MTDSIVRDTREVGAPPVLVVLPGDDALFSRVVRSRIDGVRSGAVALGAARRALRVRYPSSNLYRQRSVLVKGVPTEMWFAYRDGRNRPSLPVDRWWRKRGVARGVVDTSGRLTRMNSACRNLLRIPKPAGPLLMARDYLPAAICEELFDAPGWLPEVRSGGSTSTLPRGAERIPIEFHATWQGAGPAHHQLQMRTIRERETADAGHTIDGSSLASISARTRRELLRGATRRELAPGERLRVTVHGDAWAVLVVSGVVRLYLTAETLEATVLYSSHGSLLGTHWNVGDDEASRVGLETVTPSTILQLDARVIDRLARTHRGFAQGLLEEGRQQLNDVVQSYASRSLATLSQRLAREILLLDDLQLHDTMVPVTEKQLADGVGSMRESVARALAGLRREGWVATTRYGIILLDRDALRAHADAPA